MSVLNKNNVIIILNILEKKNSRNFFYFICKALLILSTLYLFQNKTVIYKDFLKMLLNILYEKFEQEYT